LPTEFTPMRIAFDLDNTLVDDFAKTLRPGILPLLERLHAKGHTLILFTQSTEARTRTILRDHALEQLFSLVFCREHWDPRNENPVKDLRVVEADVIVDDDPRNIAFAKSIGKHGVVVQGYRGGRTPANEIALIERAITGGIVQRIQHWLHRGLR